MIRKDGLSTKQFPLSAYAGSSKNLKDLNGDLFQGSGVVPEADQNGRLSEPTIEEQVVPHLSHRMYLLVSLRKSTLNGPFSQIERPDS